MTEPEEPSTPASPWRPDIGEPIAVLAGTLALLAVLGLWIHPFSKALVDSLALGALLALAVYLIRGAAFLVRRFSDPEASRDLASGLVMGIGLVILAVVVALLQVPADLDRAAFMTDLETRQTMALIGKDLPHLDITERHYREAFPIMELVRIQADRTRQASADFQRTIQFAKDPFNPRILGSDEGRKDARTRLSNLRSTGETMEQEALRLVGPGFLEKVQGLQVPDALKQDVARATTQNRQFTDCLEWIRVERKLVDCVDQAYTLAEKHLLLPQGQAPIWDGKASLDAFKELAGQSHELAMEAERLRQATMVQLVDDPR
jgi:hypothetical protein